MLAKRLSILLLLCCGLVFSATASHNIAGEITYRPIGNPSSYTYEITLTTYTDSKDGAQAHRDQVTIEFGDQTSEVVNIDVTKQPVGPPNSNMWLNTYVTTHKYNGPGCYIIKFTDPNRVAGIDNFTREQSEDYPFYIQTELCIDQTFGSPPVNHSPLLLEPPVSYGCKGEIYSHNPAAYDPDGDSLYYELVPPLKGEGQPFIGYVSPDDAILNGGTPNGQLTLDPVSGQITWDAPQREGWFNIAIRVYEYRRVLTPEGESYVEQVGYVTRDMQIRVANCNNQPPVITPIDDICVVAGKTGILRVTIEATDPNACDQVKLTANGGPFEVVDPKADEFGENIGNPDVARDFTWRIDCKHIRKQPYQVVVNATDNACFTNGTALTDIEYFNIRVLGPEPRNVEAEAIGNGILLDWEKPACDNAVAYYVYRKELPSNWDPDTCENGIRQGLGFKRIAIISDETQLSFYDDNNGEGLFHGVSYCYRVTALYRPQGQYEQVEGIASLEVCTSLKKDVPVITHATVDTTAIDEGQVSIAWAWPNELDSQQYPGPYEYRINTSPDLGFEQPSLVQTIPSATYRGLQKDTNAVFTNINTLELPHSYSIDLYYTNPITNTLDTVGAAKSASTPYLTITPGYEQLALSVEHDIAWINSEYVFYKQNKRTLEWDSIGVSSDGTFIDSNLVIGVTYCYLAKTIGSFGVDGFVDPIINFSQSRCAIPRDTIAPCAPSLQASANCELFYNELSWEFSQLNCANDVVGYKVYFQNKGLGDFTQIASLTGDEFFNNSRDQRDTLQFSLAGCYYITAIDSYNNESVASNMVCVDNCPEYTLPNVFSPNGDEINDLFVPFPYKFVDSVNFVVFNRWGQEVFSTTDPNLRWNGRDQSNGKKLSTGVYFYVIQVNEIRLGGDTQKTLKGSIHLLE